MSAPIAGRGLRTLRPSELAWDRAAAAHLYRRAAFGADRERLQEAVDRGFEASLAEILERREHDAALQGSIRHLLAAGDVEALQAWWMALVLADTAPLVERVTLMWHGHFATSNEKVDDVRLMHRQNELFRRLGAGDFRELLHAVAKDPAMLVWLDGNANVRGAPNENFAREVMELFGLGIGNYTESDVQEAARAFTGWGTKGRSYHYRAARHDPGSKTVFGRSGAFRGEDVIDLILEHPACSRHVARRLLVEFVMPRPEEEDVDALARTLVDLDWNVGATLELLFRSELFHSDAARRSRIAAPVELLACTAHSLGASIAPKAAAQATTRMGQSLFRPPSVKGWDGGRAWIDAGTWLARHEFLWQLATAGADEGPVRVDLSASFGAPEPRDAAVSDVLALLLPEAPAGPLADVLRAAAAECGGVDEALVEVTALVLLAPEFHRA